MRPLSDELRMASLTSSEALLLSVYRQWLTGLESRDSRCWEGAWREVSRALGGNAGRAALSALESLLRRIAGHALRTVSYHPPCCGYVAADERLLLGAVAAAGQPESDFLLGRLVGAEGLAEVREAALALAAAFAEGGHVLRPPDRETAAWNHPACAALPATPTLH